MKRLSVSLAILALTSSPLVAANPAFAKCVKWQGVDHCPIGAAKLSVASGGQSLNVTNVGTRGQDGVAAVFEPVVHWSANIAFDKAQPGDVIRLTSIADGQATSALLFRAVGDGLRASASFTGAHDQNRYTLQVLRNGQVTGSFPQQTSNSIFDIVWGPMGPPLEPIPTPGTPPTTFTIGDDGSCGWGTSFASNVIVSSGPLRAVGDEIRWIETVDPEGHYPYVGFTSIETTTNGGDFSVGDLNISNGL